MGGLMVMAVNELPPSNLLIFWGWQVSGHTKVIRKVG